MTTVDSTARDPGCTCGAAEFGPQAAHKEHCYIMLAKDAEAVTDAPVRDLAQEAVAAANAASNAASNPAAAPTAQPAPQPPRQAGERRAVTDPGAETDFCKIRFVPGLPEPLIEAWGTEGRPSIVQAGNITGKLLNVREVDTNFGLGTALDIKLSSRYPDLNDLVVGCFASSMLHRLIRQVRVGSNIEIVRIPDPGRTHVYEVYVLD